jgi:WhiB family redox-sensing transcriptional regulator
MRQIVDPVGDAQSFLRVCGQDSSCTTGSQQVNDLIDMIQQHYRDEPWKERAACIGLDSSFFFPELKGQHPEGQRICRGCPVRDECLDYAVRSGEHYGCWGGVTERNVQRMVGDFHRGVVA